MGISFIGWVGQDIFYSTRKIQSNLSPRAIYVPFDLLNEEMNFRCYNEDVNGDGIFR